jgi:hypothetical protein
MSGKKGMKSDKSWLVPRRYKGGYLDDLDGRSPDVRGVRYVRACLESDLGGAANISRMESSLVDRSAFLIYLAEEMELAVLRKKPIHVTEYLAVVNSLSGLLSRLGLRRRAKTLSLKDYLSSAKPEPPTAPSPAPKEPQPEKESAL